MGKAAYCSECKTSVWLKEDGTCVNGHGPESIGQAWDAAPETPSPAASTPKTKTHPWRLAIAVGVAMAVLAGGAGFAYGAWRGRASGLAAGLAAGETAGYERGQTDAANLQKSTNAIWAPTSIYSGYPIQTDTWLLVKYEQNFPGSQPLSCGWKVSKQYTVSDGTWRLSGDELYGPAPSY